MGFVAGKHGQDLIESGRAGKVLRACGDVLRRITRSTSPASSPTPLVPIRGVL
jgi:hypothetical protein